MAKPIIGDLNIKGMLQDDGYEFAGTDGKSIKIRDINTGDEAFIDNVREYARQHLNQNDPELLKQFSVDQFRLNINDPEDAIEESDIGFIDRAKLSLGNQKGNIAKLKQTYEDATINSKNEIVYKKDGLWKKVDPVNAGYSDPWEYAKDAADLLGDSIVIGSSIAGGAVASPLAGSTTGATIGEGIRTSLGRLVGTYDATPEEQLADAGIEAIFNLGGYGIGALAGKGLGKVFDAVTPKPELIGAAKGLGWLKDAPREVKDLAAKVVAFSSGVSNKAAQTLTHESAETLAKVNSTLAKGGTYQEMQERLAKENIADLTDIMESYKPAISKQFNEAKEAFFKSSGAEKFNLEVGDLRKVLIEGSKVPGVAIPAMSQDPVLKAFFKQNSDGLMDLIPESELNLMTNMDIGKAAAASDIYKNLKTLLNDVGRIGNVGTLKGQLDARKAVELKQFVDDFYFNTLKVDSNLKPILGEYTSSIREAVKRGIADTPSADLYNKAMDIWSSNVDNMSNIDKILKSTTRESQIGSFAKKILNGKPENEADIAGLELLRTAANSSGKAQLIKNMDIRHAAKSFVEITPYLGKLRSSAPAVTLVAAGIGMGTDTPELGVASGLAMAPLLSPRLAAKITGKTLMHSGAAFKRVTGIGNDVAEEVLPVAHKIKNFIANSSIQDKKMLRNDPHALTKLFAPLFTTFEDVQNMSKDIVNQGTQE